MVANKELLNKIVFKIPLKNLHFHLNIPCFKIVEKIKLHSSESISGAQLPVKTECSKNVNVESAPEAILSDQCHEVIDSSKKIETRIISSSDTLTEIL